MERNTLRFTPAVLFLMLIGLMSCTSRPSMSDDLEQLRERIESEEIEDPPLYREEFDRFISDHTPIVGDFMYHYILDKLRSHDDGYVSGQVAGDFSAEKCRQAPDDFRGKVWRVRGKIEDFDMAQVENEDSGRETPVYMGVLITAEQDPVVFHLVLKPGPVYVKVDQVELEGVFVKLASVATKTGEKKSVPFFMARRLRKYH